MSVHPLAPRAVARPLRAFSVSVVSSTGRQAYTALARSSGEALRDALCRLDLAQPALCSVKPLGHAPGAADPAPSLAVVTE